MVKKFLTFSALVAASGLAVAGGEDCAYSKSKTIDAKAPVSQAVVQAEAAKPAAQTAKKVAPKRDDAATTAALKKALGT
jgi:hypothetical protein